MDILNDKILTMYRGDTLITTFYINVGSIEYPSQYVLKDNDKLYVSICEPNQMFEHAAIRKIFTAADLDDNNDVVIKLASSDTENIVPGRYYIEIKLQYTDGTISTILPRKKFYIYE